MPANHSEIEKKLWSSADELRANSNLKASEYSVPVLASYSCVFRMRVSRRWSAN